MAALNPGTGVYDGDGQGLITGFLSGVALTQGTWVYLDTNNVWQKADNATAVKANAVGITLNGVSGAGMSLIVKSKGRLKGVATMAVGVSYHAAVVASTGLMQPAADNISTHFATYYGYAVTATEFEIDIHVHTVAIA
jgi:hypothetical protein